MSPQTRRSCQTKLPVAVLALLLLPGCSSIGDFDRLQPALVTDDIHAWVGQEAAARAGAPISLDNLTEEERTLRDLAFPLIEPPYDRPRWDSVLYEYGVKHEFRRELWAVDLTAYYRHLQAAGYRSTAGRYNKLIDDIRNDVVRRRSSSTSRSASSNSIGGARRACNTSPISARRIGSTRRRASARTA